MTKPLPFEDIQFCQPEERNSIAREFLEHGGAHLSENDEYGYTLETDLEIPPEYANKFSEFPPIAEKRVIHPDEYSPFMRELIKDQRLGSPKDARLINDLHPKKNYIIHYIFLKFLVSIGVKITAIHRIAKYQENRHKFL